MFMKSSNGAIMMISKSKKNKNKNLNQSQKPKTKTKNQKQKHTKNTKQNKKKTKKKIEMIFFSFITFSSLYLLLYKCHAWLFYLFIYLSKILCLKTILQSSCKNVTILCLIDGSKFLKSKGV